MARVTMYVTNSLPVMKVRETSATYRSDRLTGALTAWMDSSRKVRIALDSFLEAQR